MDLRNSFVLLWISWGYFSPGISAVQNRQIILTERVKDFYVLNGENFEAVIDVDKTFNSETLLFNVSYTLDVPGIGQVSH